MSKSVPTLAGESYFFPENPDEIALARCPLCDHAGWIDREQLCGEVSIDCPNCSYHETVDLREHWEIEL